MGEVLELPPGLKAARAYCWVRYADYQDIRAGRADRAARRILRRARIWHGGLAAVAIWGIGSSLARAAADWEGILLGRALFSAVLLASAAFAHRETVRGLKELVRAPHAPERT